MTARWRTCSRAFENTLDVLWTQPSPITRLRRTRLHHATPPSVQSSLKCQGRTAAPLSTRTVHSGLPSQPRPIPDLAVPAMQAVAMQTTTTTVLRPHACGWGATPAPRRTPQATVVCRFLRRSALFLFPGSFCCAFLQIFSHVPRLHWEHAGACCRSGSGKVQSWRGQAQIDASPKHFTTQLSNPLPDSSTSKAAQPSPAHFIRPSNLSRSLSTPVGSSPRNAAPGDVRTNTPGSSYRRATSFVGDGYTPGPKTPGGSYGRAPFCVCSGYIERVRVEAWFVRIEEPVANILGTEDFKEALRRCGTPVRAQLFGSLDSLLLRSRSPPPHMILLCRALRHRVRSIAHQVSKRRLTRTRRTFSSTCPSVNLTPMPSAIWYVLLSTPVAIYLLTPEHCMWVCVGPTAALHA